MGRLDSLRGIVDQVASKSRAGSSEGGSKAADLAGDAVVKAQEVLDGAEAVAKRAGLTNRKGEVSKLRVAAAVVRPQKSAKRLFGAAAEEIESRRALISQAQVEPSSPPEGS